MKAQIIFCCTTVFWIWLAAVVSNKKNDGSQSRPVFVFLTLKVKASLWCVVKDVYLYALVQSKKKKKTTK